MFTPRGERLTPLYSFLDALLAVGVCLLAAGALAPVMEWGAGIGAVQGDPLADALRYLPALLAAWCARAGLDFLAERVAHRGETDGLRRLREGLSAILSDPRHRPSRPAAAAVLTVDTAAQRAAATRTIRPLETRLRIHCAVVLVAVGMLNLPAAGLLLLTLPFLPVFVVLIGRGTAARWAAHVREHGELGDAFADRLRGLATLLALRRDGEAAAALAAEAEAFERGLAGVMRLSFLTRAVVSFLASASIASVAIFLGLYLLGYIDFGAFPRDIDFRLALAVLLLLPEFYAPLLEYIDRYHEKRAADGAAEVLAPVMEWKAAMAPEGAEALPPGAVALRDIRFAYGAGSAPLLDGAALSARPGEWIGITGASGAGKTTLLKIAAGVLVPDAGLVRVGGRVAYVPQAERLLAASLVDNVYPGGGGDVGDVAALAGELGIAPTTRIGPGGHALSGGQVRRVMLERALRSGAEVLLLDEVFAHVDEPTAEGLLGRLRAGRDGRTIVQVSHAPRYLRYVDRVVAVTGTVSVSRMATA